jgi:hypothetical protein
MENLALETRTIYKAVKGGDHDGVQEEILVVPTHCFDPGQAIMINNIYHRDTNEDIDTVK